MTSAWTLVRVAFNEAAAIPVIVCEERVDEDRVVKRDIIVGEDRNSYGVKRTLTKTQEMSIGVVVHMDEAGSCEEC